ncbi:hypothetical protein PC116_g28790 [Phytophthora cactorum]|nr:hypothetical protein PC116_g28790 [Phytophthora cactorum]
MADFLLVGSSKKTRLQTRWTGSRLSRIPRRIRLSWIRSTTSDKNLSSSP